MINDQKFFHFRLFINYFSIFIWGFCIWKFDSKWLMNEYLIKFFKLIIFHQHIANENSKTISFRKIYEFEPKSQRKIRRFFFENCTETFLSHCIHIYRRFVVLSSCFSIIFFHSLFKLNSFSPHIVTNETILCTSSSDILVTNA